MTAPPTTDAAPNLPPRTRRLADHLRSELAKTEGDLYVKSRFIADDMDDSPQEIGAAMRTLAAAEAGPAVEKWAYSSATTWRVSD
ncbi:hypothetical protein ACKVMT_10460 [Halobacteriales archaeon Cl-PHB]